MIFNLSFRKIFKKECDNMIGSSNSLNFSGGGSSGSGGLTTQADYNQNDATKSDYIKNRPCYIDGLGEYVKLYEGNNLNGSDINQIDFEGIITEMPLLTDRFNISIKNNNDPEFTVYSDIALREETVSIDDVGVFNILAAGNLVKLGLPDTGENYSLAFVDASAMGGPVGSVQAMLAFNETVYPYGDELYTVKIEKASSTVVPLPSYYLPSNFMNTDRFENDARIGSKLVKTDGNIPIVEIGSQAKAGIGEVKSSSLFGNSEVAIGANSVASGGYAVSINTSTTDWNSDGPDEFTATKVNYNTIDIDSDFVRDLFGKNAQFILFDELFNENGDNKAIDESKMFELPLFTGTNDFYGNRNGIGSIGSITQTCAGIVRITFSGISEGNPLPDIPNSGKVVIFYGGSVSDRNGDNGTIAIGNKAVANFESVALGHDSIARNSSFAALQGTADFDSIAVGLNSNASTNSIAIGKDNTCFDGGIALGTSSTVRGKSIYWSSHDETVSGTVFRDFHVTISRHSTNSKRFVLSSTGNNVEKFKMVVSKVCHLSVDDFGYIDIIIDSNPVYNSSVDSTTVEIVPYDKSYVEFLTYLTYDNPNPYLYWSETGIDTSGVFAAGRGLVAKKGTTERYQTILGRFNVDDPDKLLIVGTGNSHNDRSNAFTLDPNGNAKFKGTVEAEDVKIKSGDSYISVNDLASGGSYTPLNKFADYISANPSDYTGSSNYTFTNTDNCGFMITGNVCYMTFQITCVDPDDVELSNALPKTTLVNALPNYFITLYDMTGDNSSIMFMRLSSTATESTLHLHGGIAGKTYIGSFSFPIK